MLQLQQFPASSKNKHLWILWRSPFYMFLVSLKKKIQLNKQMASKKNNIKQNKKISQLAKSFKPFNLLFSLVNKEEKRL